MSMFDIALQRSTSSERSDAPVGEFRGLRRPLLRMRQVRRATSYIVGAKFRRGLRREGLDLRQLPLGM